MNNITARVLFNCGTDRKVIDQLLDLLEAAGYKGIETCRRVGHQYASKGSPISFCTENSNTTLTYAETKWFDQETGMYGNLPTVNFVKQPPPIKIGDYVAQVTSGGVQVGCTFVSWTTIEELQKRRKTL